MEEKIDFSKRIRIAELVGGKIATGICVLACGWVRNRRSSKAGVTFVEINDGSCFDSLQAVLPDSLDDYGNLVSTLFPGTSVAICGELVPSPGAGQAVELRADSVRVLGECDPLAYPLGKQRVTFERLRELPHLRARTNTFGAMARVRNTLAAEIHRFFQSRGFIYVNTPLITASDCEGAGAMFQATTLDIANPPRLPDGTIDYSADFFGRRASLTVSGQLEGETYACAMGDIYTFGPTFRAENSNTRRHLAEFWMVEPEMAFADLDADAALAEALLRHLAACVLEAHPSDLAFFEKRVLEGLAKRLESLASSPFHRITYTEAIERLLPANGDFEYPVKWGDDLQAEHERYLTGEKVFDGPVIVTDYPRAIKPFYMRASDDGRTVAAMDVLLPDVGEIIGGSQREERLPQLEAAMRASGVDPAQYANYLDLRRFGSVPHAGFGLGFERMVQYCTGLANIRDVIPYPRVPGNCR